VPGVLPWCICCVRHVDQLHSSFFDGKLTEQTLILTFQSEQVSFGIQSAGETGELSGKADDPVARRDDGDRIPPIRSADGSCSSRVPQLDGKLSVGAGFSKRDSKERLPHSPLKRRAAHIKRNGELRSLAGKVLVEFDLSLKQDRMLLILFKVIEADTSRIILFPENGRQALVTSNQL
jgi:hypothetical protein